ncbi:hypothetical protein LSM04_001277 [Trypanosoma melophagium]|uniref:uncharacterized protein n=1 Tax=Trypanosoma melophagium TaxID=715481 RepID=UPI003519DCF7|nr:hypothetical protein LSM04_001277 [Trypanosoma melophagium]
MMHQRGSQSLWISTNKTPNITHRNSGDTSSHVDELISTLKRSQNNAKCSKIGPMYSFLSPVHVGDISGVCDRSVKRPVSLRRTCLDTSRDSSESSILSE